MEYRLEILQIMTTIYQTLTTVAAVLADQTSVNDAWAAYGP